MSDIIDGGTLPEVTITPNPFSIDFLKLEKAFQPLQQIQKDSINAIVGLANKYGIRVKAQLAYILATAWHESRWAPISEWGGEAYLRKKPYYPYYGRGFCQLTWEENYRKEGQRLGINLVKYPQKALEIPVAADIIVHGMINGSFTGKKLSDYITPDKKDFVNARRIINGKDRATDISEYAEKIIDCIVG